MKSTHEMNKEDDPYFGLSKKEIKMRELMAKKFGRDTQHLNKSAIVQEVEEKRKIKETVEENQRKVE